MLWRRFEKVQKREIEANKKQEIEDILYYFQKIYYASALFNNYYPYEIDHFMENLDVLVNDEFSRVKFEGNNDNIAEEVRIYINLIIHSILHQEKHSIGDFLKKDNYIKRLTWSISKEAGFLTQKLIDYFKDNVKIIDFNIDNHFETLIPLYLNIPSSEVLNKMTKIYSELDHKRNNDKFNISAIGITEFLKLSNKEKEGFLRERYNFMPPYIPNRKVLAKDFLEADEIIFLGFNFDFNELYKLGLITLEKLLEDSIKNKTKRTYISVIGGDEKEVNIFKNLLKIKNFENSFFYKIYKNT